MMKFQDKSQWSREGSKVVVHFHPREGIWRIFFFQQIPTGCSLQFEQKLHVIEEIMDLDSRCCQRVSYLFGQAHSVYLSEYT